MTRTQQTTALTVGAIMVAAALGIAFAKRAADPGGSVLPISRPGVASLTSGQGVKIRFSDKPVQVPVFSLQTLDGETITPESFKGKVLLINFWATWCGPCREEIPELIALQAHYKDQLVVLGLSVDERPPADVKAFATAQSMNYPVAIADMTLQKAFGGITAVPATFVVNPDGGIVQRHVGLLEPQMTEQEVRVLSHLSSAAVVEIVPDTGQVLIANAAYATEIPGVDLKGVTPDQKEAILKRLNTEKCTCGCDRTLAQCRIEDPACQTSLPAAKKVAAEVVGGK
jgi:thiol-disulfide isomerase/thioredoxin